MPMNCFRGDKLAQWRRHEGLSQAELAALMTGLAYRVLGRACRITQERVHRFERGARPDPELVRLTHAATAGALDANALFMTTPGALALLGETPLAKGEETA